MAATPRGPKDYLDLARSPEATADQLRSLATSPHSFVIEAVAAHPNTPPSVLAVLLPANITSYADAETVLALVRNPNTPLQVLAGVPDLVLPQLQERDRQVAFAAGVELTKRSDTPWEVLVALVSDDLATTEFRKVVARETVSRELCQHLLEDRSERVRRAAQANANCNTQASIELREITSENREEVLALRVPPEQQRFVGGTFADALADADKFPEAKPWPRAVYLNGKPVGFVMLSWNVDPDPPWVIGPWYLWKLVIDQRHQGLGLGGEVVRLVADIARREGASELLTSYADEEGGPGPFYAKLGFIPTGEPDVEDEIIVSLTL